MGNGVMIVMMKTSIFSANATLAELMVANLNNGGPFEAYRETADDLQSAIGQAKKAGAKFLVVDLESVDAASMLMTPAGIQHIAGGVKLTRRETEVAQYVAKGLGNRRISQVLSLQEQSVKNLVSAIMRKLNCENRTTVALKLTGKETEIGWHEV